MKQHPATEPIVQIIGPHLTRDCARELAGSIVENLLATGWLKPTGPDYAEAFEAVRISALKSLAANRERNIAQGSQNV